MSRYRSETKSESRKWIKGSGRDIEERERSAKIREKDIQKQI